MQDGRVDDGFPFTVPELCESVGPVLERLWRDRGTPPPVIDVPRDDVAIQAMADDLLPVVALIEREQRLRDLLREREERSRREAWPPATSARLIEPLRGKITWAAAVVSRQLRDDDVRRDLRRLTLLIRRSEDRVPTAPGASGPDR